MHGRTRTPKGSCKLRSPPIFFASFLQGLFSNRVPTRLHETVDACHGETRSAGDCEETQDSGRTSGRYAGGPA